MISFFLRLAVIPKSSGKRSISGLKLLKSLESSWSRLSNFVWNSSSFCFRSGFSSVDLEFELQMRVGEVGSNILSFEDKLRCFTLFGPVFKIALYLTFFASITSTHVGQEQKRLFSFDWTHGLMTLIILGHCKHGSVLLGRIHTLQIFNKSWSANSIRFGIVIRSRIGQCQIWHIVGILLPRNKWGNSKYCFPVTFIILMQTGQPSEFPWQKMRRGFSILVIDGVQYIP